MKRIALLLSGLGLISLGARADDTVLRVEKDRAHADEVRVKNERDHKIIEKKHNQGRYGSKTKVESKSRRKLFSRGRVDTTETVQEQNRPGLGNDTRRKVTETKERDEHGNVIRHEKKVSE